MKKTVYILCAPEERELPEVKKLCSVLDKNNCVYYFSTAYSQELDEPSTYNMISEADAFVAIIGETCDSGSAYHSELWLAWQYCYEKNRGKPELYGVPIQNHTIPECSQKLVPYINFLPDMKTGYEEIFKNKS